MSAKLTDGLGDIINHPVSLNTKVEDFFVISGLADYFSLSGPFKVMTKNYRLEAESGNYKVIGHPVTLWLSASFSMSSMSWSSAIISWR